MSAIKTNVQPGQLNYFGGKAIKEISLINGTIYLSYLNKNGCLKKINFQKFRQVDAFLSNVLEGYEKGQFDDNVLRKLVETIERPLKQIFADENESKVGIENIKPVRYFIGLAVEAIFKIHLAKTDREAINIVKTESFIKDKTVCIYYKNIKNRMKEDYLMITENHVDFHEFLKFADSCLPNINSRLLSFLEAEILCKEMYRKHLDRAKFKRKLD